MSIALAIEKLVPAAQYRGSLTEDYINRQFNGDGEAAYNALVWEDARNKPLWTDIETALTNIQSERNNFERWSKFDSHVNGQLEKHLFDKNGWRRVLALNNHHTVDPSSDTQKYIDKVLNYIDSEWAVYASGSGDPGSVAWPNDDTGAPITFWTVYNANSNKPI